MSLQLPLTIQLNIEANLNDFYWDNNQLLKQQIDKLLKGDEERFLTLWGNSGSGKSHLLQACCQEIDMHNRGIYLPLATLNEFGPESINGLEDYHLIAIDDIHVIVGNRAWEEALFHLYNKARDKEGTILIVSTQYPLNTLQFRLPDLHSRLTWGLVIRLYELGDEVKVKLIRQYARKRGFELPLNVSRFLINRCSRNLLDLDLILTKLDQASLSAQRKITVPFVKSILNI